VREAFPNLPVYARAWDIRMAQRLLSLGVTYAIPETMATGLQLTRDVLHASGISPEVTAQLFDNGHGGEPHIIKKLPTPDKKSGYKDILLVLTPGIDTAATLGYAVTLAEDNQAALTVVEVLTETSTSDEQGEGVSSPDELEEQMEESRCLRLKKLVTGLQTTLDVQVKVLVGRSHEEVTREVVSNGRDLVLKIAEGGHGLRESLFGNNDSWLLKTCPCPVLLIRSIPPKPYRHRRICAGIYQDENPGGHRDDRYVINHKILEQASWLATAQFAELHVVHAWEAYGEQDLRSGRSPFHFEADSYVEREQKRNKEAMDKWVSELRESMESDVLPAFNPMCHLVKGNHRDEIIRLAISMEADLVVVGDLVHSEITNLFVENTAMAISKHLNCSILMVKPQGFVSPVVVEEL